MAHVGGKVHNFEYHKKRDYEKEAREQERETVCGCCVGVCTLPACM